MPRARCAASAQTSRPRASEAQPTAAHTLSMCWRFVRDGRPTMVRKTGEQGSKPLAGGRSGDGRPTVVRKTGRVWEHANSITEAGSGTAGQQW
eukprot:209321-Chlamydomonas_euryale.AAC.4